MINNRFLAHLLGLVGFFLTGIVIGFGYLAIVGGILGLGKEGFGLAGAIVTFPFLSIPLAFLWVLIWEIWKVAKKRPFGRVGVIVASLILGLVFSIVFAGPRGFTMAGGSTLFNYFIIALVMLGSLVHSFLVPKTTADQD